MRGVSERAVWVRALCGVGALCEMCTSVSKEDAHPLIHLAFRILYKHLELKLALQLQCSVVVVDCGFQVADRMCGLLRRCCFPP